MRKLSALLMVIVGLLMLIFVRLELTWGNRYFTAAHGWQIAAGIGMFALAVWTWRSPRAKWLAIIFAVAALVYFGAFQVSRMNVEPIDDGMNDGQ